MRALLALALLLALSLSPIATTAQPSCPSGMVCFPWHSTTPVAYTAGIDVEWEGADVWITTSMVYVKPLQACWRVTFSAGDFSAVWVGEDCPTPTPTPAPVYKVWLIQVWR